VHPNPLNETDDYNKSSEFGHGFIHEFEKNPEQQDLRHGGEEETEELKETLTQLLKIPGPRNSV
jgi:hypothetical protein